MTPAAMIAHAVTAGDGPGTFPAAWAAGWAAEGRPLPRPTRTDGPCELCGHRGARVEWLPPPGWTAFDQHAAPGERAVCQGCAMLLTGGPGTTPKGRPARWMWHTLATNLRACEWLRKPERDRIATLVADPEWSVSVADGCRHHTAFLAPVTRPGRVRVGYDGHTVDLPARDWATITNTIREAVAAGVPATALTGPLSHSTIRRLGVARARRVNDVLQPHRSTATLDLAVFLAPRKENPPS